MVSKLNRWTLSVLFGFAGLACATPALPASTLASDAVRQAMVVTPPPAPVAQPTPVQAARPQPAQNAAAQTAAAQTAAAQTAAAQTAAAQTAAARATAAQNAAARQAQAARQAAQARAAAIAQTQRQQAQQAAAPVAALTVRGRSAIVRATAYNSLVGQTDSTPFITATGTRTRPGVVALSRDMLRSFPYGTRIAIEDLSGRYNNLLRGRVFIVEDTMAARKTGSLDIWMSTHSQAITFGARQVRITALR
ncbi:3D domain-containing protein [Deinococcus frigens]|uniref:3D domain-containing protein n=1 Tax=Deinococcus frigens TaxID=249403 RepID=UPI000496B0AF|nr:3D domain-containing protein [Deinococcus frigens]